MQHAEYSLRRIQVPHNTGPAEYRLLRGPGQNAESVMREDRRAGERERKSLDTGAVDRGDRGVRVS